MNKKSTLRSVANDYLTHPKRNKGITLIALVVTIIVLLILAGISIAMLSGNNGILTKAGEARDLTGEKQIAERVQLANLAALTLGEGQLTYSNLNTELTKEFGEKGTGYNISDESENPWKIKVGNVEYDISHEENASTEIQPGESGYAGGNYDNPYIPINFEHKSGSTTDWNAGYTIIGKTGTENENDEFVWVPCVTDQAIVKPGDTVQTYTKITTGKYISNYLTLHPSSGTNNRVNAEDATVAEIRTSVGRYGGFYIAKYEGGIAGNKDNHSLSPRIKTDGSVKPLSQAGIGVWNSIARTESLTVSKAMIPVSTGVKSTLISGECWDTTLAWITATADFNYAENSTGKGWHNDISSNNIHTTGYYGTNTNNIFDMAGNVREYTSENCLYDDSEYDPYQGLINRGGDYLFSGVTHPASHREAFYDADSINVGFRVVLYKEV